MSLVNNLSSILSSCLHCFSLLWCYIIFLTHPFFFCLPAWGDFFKSCLPFFDCFLAAAWWAVLHLLYYSYFDGLTPQATVELSELSEAERGWTKCRPLFPSRALKSHWVVDIFFLISRNLSDLYLKFLQFLISKIFFLLYKMWIF